MHSAPVIGLYAFPRFMSIDNNGGANSHAPCVVGVSQALRSLRQALACKRVLVHVSPPDILAAEAHRPLGRIITGLYLTVRFAMQVARSLRIRSHCLVVPAGKARRTQVQQHAATRGNVGWLTDTSLLPERKIHANLLFFRCTQPEADGSLEYSLSTDTGRKPNSEERRALC